MTCVPHSRIKHDERRHTCDGDLAFNRKTCNFSFYLVLLFYHVVLEELVAIGTGAKPRFCSLIPYFFEFRYEAIFPPLDPQCIIQCLRPSNG